MASFIGDLDRVYHELVPVPPRWVCSRLALVSLCLAWAFTGCGDAHWESVRWPSDRSGAPPQPTLGPTEYGLAVEATAIDYEPAAIVVGLRLTNHGAATLAIERAAIMLHVDELEYASEPPTSAEPEPAWIRLEPSTSAELRLRYSLGRPLIGSGSTLIFRSLTRDDVAIVELPALKL